MVTSCRKPVRGLRARSISLSSADLGVSARVDVVEGTDGWVVPVEIKKGRPQPGGQPWPNHRAQVVVQGMLLSEAGYACNRADVYYAASQQRLTVDVSEAQLSWARSVIDDAFVVRDRARAQAPLVDSPKCDRCSLAGICLPDETNHLTGKTSHAARRVLPRDPDARPAYVTEPVNALLSFCYALLVKDLVATALGVGLDPHLGLYHSTRGNRPALALDLAEEFRPLIADSVVLRLINNYEIGDADFVFRAGAVNLTAQGRRKVINAYEDRLAKMVRHPEFDYELSYRRVLDLQARLLAGSLVGEAAEYRPMVTR